MLFIERAARGELLTALPAHPGQTGRYCVEIVPIFPRSDLDPSLSPFERAARHVSDIFVQVQQLLREDLHDLNEPLLTCQAYAQTAEQRAVLDLLTSEVARLDEMLSQRMELLREHWQRGIAVLAENRSQVVEQTIALPG